MSPISEGAPETLSWRASICLFIRSCHQSKSWFRANWGPMRCRWCQASPGWRQCCPSSGATCPRGCLLRPENKINSFQYLIFMSCFNSSKNKIFKICLWYKPPLTEHCSSVELRSPPLASWSSSWWSGCSWWWWSGHHDHDDNDDDDDDRRCLISVFISPICSSSPVISVISCSRTFMWSRDH